MPKFKTYTMNQIQLLPPSYDELIPADHLVRVVNSVIDSLNLNKLYSRYKEAGCPAYHPRMMLKVLIFAYTQKTYSSRQIAKALRENINFMWLSGDQKPDFRTVNRFRSDMKDIIEEVFYAVVMLLLEKGYIKQENYFLDGTKIEANANKYSFKWKKSVVKYDAKLDDKIRIRLKEIDRITQEENDLYQDNDLEETGEIAERITSEQVKKIAEEIEKRLEETARAEDKEAKDKGVRKSRKKLKKIHKELKDDIIPRKERYEQDLEIFGERNSYSKTDHDATFMRMKEDHMLNGQLKPGYNVQIGTENTYIVGYTIHPNPTDTKTLIPHLEHQKEQLGKLPHTVIADSGYGSEENYEYLKQNSCESCVKYGTYHKEQTKKHKNNPFLADNMLYDAESDSYTCPNGRKLEHSGSRKYTTEAGYQTRRDIYRCQDCSGCPYAEQCKKGESRSIQVSHRLNELKRETRENLCSPTGQVLAARRSSEVEQTFGRIKGCWSFRRFLLRGIEKVKIEWGLLSIAHNITKMALEG